MESIVTSGARQFVSRPAIALAFLCTVFGTTFGAIAIGIKDGWPPLLSAGLRFAVAGTLVLGFAAMRGELRRPPAAGIRGIVAIGLTVTAATFAALYSAERILPSGLCALLSATSPLFAVAIAIGTRRRRFDVFVVAGVVFGSAGVALVAGVGGGIAGTAATIAALAIVLSEFGFSWGLSRARVVSEQVPMLQLAGAQQLVGGVVLLALSLVFEHRGPARLDVAGVTALLYLAVVASAVAGTVSIWLASVTNATFASTWAYISPFIALAFGLLALHEPIGPSAWLGGILVIAGAYAINRPPSVRRDPRCAVTAAGNA